MFNLCYLLTSSLLFSFYPFSFPTDTDTYTDTDTDTVNGIGTFELDDSIFNHSNPAADSPYTLDMSKPYDHSVACTLIDMMENDPVHCIITEITYKETSKSSNKNINVIWIDGIILDKNTNKKIVIPTIGELIINFKYKERIPTEELAMSDHAVFILQIIIVTAKSEQDKRNWLKLLVRDIYCTTQQAQSIINHFIEKQVIGLGGLKTVDIITAIWSRLLDPQNMVEFLMKNIDSIEIRKGLILGMGFDLLSDCRGVY